jgi:hypothetical protein
MAKDIRQLHFKLDTRPADASRNILAKSGQVSRSEQPVPKFHLCDFFDARGKRVERIFICMEEGQEATDRLRTAMKAGGVNILLDVMKSEAFTGKPTSFPEAALALNAFLQEVAGQRLPLQQAKTVTTIRVDFGEPVTIQETLPALEKAFGGYAISWARGIFRPLKLGSPYLN